MTELGVLVEAELGVHAEHIPTLDLRQRVDLDLGGVLLLEELVQLDEDVGGLVDVGGLEAELLGRLGGELVREAVLEVDGDGDDGGRVVTGNVLDAADDRGQLSTASSLSDARRTSCLPGATRRARVLRFHGR